MATAAIGIIIKTCLLKISTYDPHFPFWKNENIWSLYLFLDYN